MKYCQANKGLELFAYVIMSNHIHMIAKAKDQPLNILLGNFKSYTSKQRLNKLSKTQGKAEKIGYCTCLNFMAKATAKMKKFNFGKMEIIQLAYGVQRLLNKK